MKEFSTSQEAHWRRFVRGAIRKSMLTRAERDVTLAIANLWFHHRNGPEKAIHPGREKLAKTARVTVKTVSRCLALLRDAGVLIPITATSGGRTPTAYRMQMLPLLELCGCDFPEWMEGDLEPLEPGHKPGHSRAENGPKNRDKMSHGIYNTVQAFPSQSISNDNGTSAGPTRFLAREGGK